ncbi:MAG TPA: hypothetical protein PKC26_08025, partial [Plasticicumulans sp.]|nr:hypothetical protein [Plasticicumulans sp.]
AAARPAAGAVRLRAVRSWVAASAPCRVLPAFALHCDMPMWITGGFIQKLIHRWGPNLAGMQFFRQQWQHTPPRDAREG